MMEMVVWLTPSLLLLICLCLLGAGAGRVVLLLKGALEARRQRANGTDGNWATLLRSDLVPAVAVIAAPPDASEPDDPHRFSGQFHERRFPE